MASALIVDGGWGVHIAWMFLEGREITATATPDRHCTDYVAQAIVGNRVIRRIFEH